MIALYIFIHQPVRPSTMDEFCRDRLWGVDASIESCAGIIKDLNFEDWNFRSPSFRDITKLGKVGYGLKALWALDLCVHTVNFNHPFFRLKFPIFWTFKGFDHNPWIWLRRWGPGALCDLHEPFVVHVLGILFPYNLEQGGRVLSWWVL